MIAKKLMGLMYSSDFTSTGRIGAQTISGGSVGAGGYKTTADTDYIKAIYPGKNTDGITIIADIDITFVNGRYQYIAITESVPNYYFDFIFEENVGTGGDAGKKRLLFYSCPAGVLRTSSVYVSPGRHTIGLTITTGNVLTFYVDGAVLGSTFSTSTGTIFVSDFYIAGSPLGSYSLNGTISRLEIYNNAFSATEMLKDYNHSNFNYDSDWVVYYDMFADSYDLVNAKLYDKSGKGLDSLLGDGSTSTYYPTKLLTGRGLYFDVSDDYTYTPTNISHNSTIWSAVVFLYDASTTTAYRRWFMNNYGTIAAGFNGVREDSTSGIDVVLNGVSNVITGYSWKGRPAVIILTCDGTNSYLYLDGNLIGTISSKTGNFNGTPLYLGGYNVLGVSEHFNGNVYAFGLNKQCFTLMQVKDITYRLKSQLNLQ